MIIAQYGTKHGHAAGKLAALRTNPHVELAGVFEPDEARREALRHAGWPYDEVRWFRHAEELLADPHIVAVAAEGANHESLDQAESIIRAGKHIWYDKPAGEDWEQWQQVAALAAEQRLVVQLGYMFRYHHGFRQITDWVRSGFLGDIFAVRAHMSTWIDLPQRQQIARHPGGIFYDLAGHMLDQLVWMLGKPERVTSFLRNDTGSVMGFADNTLAVLEYRHALASIDIAAMETPPMARRFEVYGLAGSALMEPFEPATQIRLCLMESRDGYFQGEQFVTIAPQTRQELYDRELDAFLATIRGEQPAARPAQHDLAVQETLLRAAGFAK